MQFSAQCEREDYVKVVNNKDFLADVSHNEIFWELSGVTSQIICPDHIGVYLIEFYVMSAIS